MKVLILNSDVYSTLSYMICGWLKTNLENAFQDCLYSNVGLVHRSSVSVRTEEEQCSCFCTGVNSIWGSFCVLWVKLSNVLCKKISAVFCRFLISALTHAYTTKTWWPFCFVQSISANLSLAIMHELTPATMESHGFLHPGRLVTLI